MKTETRNRIVKALTKVGIHPHLIHTRLLNIQHQPKRLDAWLGRLPIYIGVEISIACNRRCGYCPQSVLNPKQEFMDDELWLLFRDRLREYGWRGRVRMGMHSEMSLVPHSERYVRDLAFIGAKPEIVSNGDRPSVILSWLDAGAHRVMVSQHLPSPPEWRKNLEIVERVGRGRVSVFPIQPQRVHDWAGQVKKGSVNTTEKQACYRANSMEISVRGTMGLCCVDWNHHTQLGDIRNSTLKELWNDKRNADVRRRVIKGQAVSPLCFPCFKNELPLRTYKLQHELK